MNNSDLTMTVELNWVNNLEIILELVCLDCKHIQEMNIPTYRTSFEYCCSKCGKQIEVYGLPDNPKVRYITPSTSTKRVEHIYDIMGNVVAAAYYD